MTRKVISKVMRAAGQLAVISACWIHGSVQAQTVPTDLLDLSIEELFDANVVTEADRAETARRWHVSYTYAVSDYDEYYLGTHSLSYDEVLFTPGAEARTENNYPVMPTEISQEIHALRLAYDVNESVTIRAQVPLVREGSEESRPVARRRGARPPCSA